MQPDALLCNERFDPVLLCVHFSYSLLLSLTANIVANSEQMKLLAEADAKLSETSAHVTKTRQKRNALALEKMNLKNNLTHLKDEAFSMEKKVASLAKRYEEARNKDVFLAETK